MISAFYDSFKIPDLRSRILFTLAMIVIVRIGTAVTLPGVDMSVLDEWIKIRTADSAGAGAQVAALLNVFSGGGLQKFAPCRCAEKQFFDFNRGALASGHRAQFAAARIELHGVVLFSCA